MAAELSFRWRHPVVAFLSGSVRSLQPRGAIISLDGGAQNALSSLRPEQAGMTSGTVISPRAPFRGRSSSTWSKSLGDAGLDPTVWFRNTECGVFRCRIIVVALLDCANGVLFPCDFGTGYSSLRYLKALPSIR